MAPLIGYARRFIGIASPMDAAVPDLTAEPFSRFPQRFN